MSQNRPQLNLDGNIKENFKNFELRFDDYCIQADYRDLEKDPNSDDHYKKPLMEISALRSALPDEALSVVRYTIEPQIAEADKKKPRVWMEKLREHYIGKIGSSLMADRYQFWSIQQSPHESIQEWEVKVRQFGSLCEYTNQSDMMCRDKFVFGLKDETLRTELLKSHLTSTGSAKSLYDVAQEAKAYEAAVRANRIIEERTKTDEQVNWTKPQRRQRSEVTRITPQQKTESGRFVPHRLMKLRREPGTCHWCGDDRGPHPWHKCPAKGKTCAKCGLNDHFARVCLEQKSSTHAKTVNEINIEDNQHHNSSNYESERDIYNDEDIYAVNPVLNQPSRRSKGLRYFAHLPLSLSGDKFQHIKLQIDTAASCNTISLQDITKLSGYTRAHLSKSPYTLHPYGDSTPIQPIGQIELVCERKSCFYTLIFQVLPDNVMKGKPALLSGTDSIRLGLVQMNADEIYQVNLQKHHPNKQSLMEGKLTQQALMDTYSSVFDGLGFLGPPVSFKVNKNITPINMPVHRVPIAKREKEKEAIHRYVEAGILKKVTEPTPWCSNELIRETPKKFRVCIDPSQTVNKAIMRPIHQLPTLNEQLHRLSNAKLFSLVDAKEGFLQCPLDEESSLLTTMHTSLGRYRWLRLPFGISSAPEEFQQRLLTALEGLDGIICIADDILIFGEGSSLEEAEISHDTRITALFERCMQKNIKLNKAKLRFKLKEVKFMGHTISDRGISPDPDKIEAIAKLPTPKSKAELMRVVGMLNYLSPFCQNLSALIQPLRALTKDGVEYQWSSLQENAFTEAKKRISSAPTLMYYDLQKPVILQVDASDRGLGGALLQPNKENKLQPVAFTSCSMSETETRYSQIEKECLAICNCFQKFDQWLYGKHDIEVHTDHKPLESIMQKPLNKAPARLQRMMMRLQRYQFKITYKPGPTMYLADTLSRASLSNPVSAKVTGFEVFRLIVQEPEENPRLSTPTVARLKDETQKDTTLLELYLVITNGWPADKSKLAKCLLPYWTYRDELSIQDGIIYKGCRVLVPQALVPYMLKRIHASHLGAESNIRMAKDVLFWPGMRAAIYDMCSSCGTCAAYNKTLSKEPMRSLPIPSLPWQIVSQDIFSYESKSYLVTVCHYSDWIEVDELSNTLAKTVIEKTKAHFSRFGVPAQCHTDNGPQFISQDFKDFASAYGFFHVTSSPYHPQGNGRAEAAVKVAKTMLKKSHDLEAALLNYRNTPPRGHSFSPAQRLLSRRTRTTVPTANAALLPAVAPVDIVHAEISAKRMSAKEHYDKGTANHMPLAVGDYVYAKPPPAKRGQPWTYGRVNNIPAPRSYVISTPAGGEIRRNRVHIQQAQAPPPPQKMSVSSHPCPSSDTPPRGISGTRLEMSFPQLESTSDVASPQHVQSDVNSSTMPDTCSRSIQSTPPSPAEPVRRTRTRIIRAPQRYGYP